MERIEMLNQLYQSIVVKKANYLKLFKLERDFKPVELKKAYRKISNIVHPDNWVNDLEEHQTLAQECANYINHAYEILNNEDTRDYYLKTGKERDARDVATERYAKSADTDEINALFDVIEDFEIGKQVIVTPNLPLKLAYFGGTTPIKYKLSNGEEVSLDLEIPVGTNPGTAFIFKNMGEYGKGAGVRGDLTVIVNFKIPNSVEIGPNKMVINVSKPDNELKFHEGKLTHIKILGRFVAVGDNKVQHNKRNGQIKIENMGMYSIDVATRGNLILQLPQSQKAKQVEEVAKAPVEKRKMEEVVKTLTESKPKKTTKSKAKEQPVQDMDKGKEEQTVKSALDILKAGLRK